MRRIAPLSLRFVRSLAPFLAFAPFLTLASLAAQDDHRTLAALVDAMAQKALAADKVPGASLLVAIGDNEILAKGYGEADIENDVPAAPQTVFRIGSITKQFTAAAILKLVDAGKLKLDDELNELVPAFGFGGKKVTVHQLLNHTSGIRSYTGLGQKFWSLANRRLSHEQLYELIKDEPFDFEPGAGWKYNNSGYYLLGVIIEKVSGKSYAEFVGEQLWKPVEMTQTRYGGSDPIVKHRARGYSKSNGKVVNCRLMSMRPPFAAGASFRRRGICTDGTWHCTAARCCPRARTER